MNSAYLYKGLFCVLLLLPLFAQTQTTVVKSRAANVHVVGKGETLNGIARKNNCTVEQLLKLNQGLTNNTLKYGSKITIPVTTRLTNTGSTMVKTLTETSVSTDVKCAPGFSPTYHVVKAGETLSAIAIHYRKTISDLRQWNHFTGNNLVAGKKIIVDETVENLHNNYTLHGDLVETVQNGIAKWEMDTVPASTGGMLCGLCSDVPAGNIVKITNAANNQTILVKVTGKLSANDEDEHVLIRISTNAARQLNALDEKFAAKLSYFLPAQLSLK